MYIVAGVISNIKMSYGQMHLGLCKNHTIVGGTGHQGLWHLGGPENNPLWYFGMSALTKKPNAIVEGDTSTWIN